VRKELEGMSGTGAKPNIALGTIADLQFAGSVAHRIMTEKMLIVKVSFKTLVIFLVLLCCTFFDNDLLVFLLANGAFLVLV
jgi:hypothetical protein